MGTKDLLKLVDENDDFITQNQSLKEYVHIQLEKKGDLEKQINTLNDALEKVNKETENIEFKHFQIHDQIMKLEDMFKDFSGIHYDQVQKSSAIEDFCKSYIFSSSAMKNSSEHNCHTPCSLSEAIKGLVTQSANHVKNIMMNEICLMKPSFHGEKNQDKKSCKRESKETINSLSPGKISKFGNDNNGSFVSKLSSPKKSALGTNKKNASIQKESPKKASTVKSISRASTIKKSKKKIEQGGRRTIQPHGDEMQIESKSIYQKEQPRKIEFEDFDEEILSLKEKTQPMKSFDFKEIKQNKLRNQMKIKIASTKLNIDSSMVSEEEIQELLQQSQKPDNESEKIIEDANSRREITFGKDNRKATLDDIAETEKECIHLKRKTSSEMFTISKEIDNTLSKSKELSNVIDAFLDRIKSVCAQVI